MLDKRLSKNFIDEKIATEIFDLWHFKYQFYYYYVCQNNPIR